MNKKYSYNTLSFVIFSALFVAAFSFFTFADDTSLTLFEDFDRDGLSNAEEKTFGTNPKEADTDNDGYSDGVEIESGYNPLIKAPGDRIIKEKKLAIITPIQTKTDNVTKKISENVVSYLADAQEAGNTEITSEEFSEAISSAIDKEVVLDSTTPINMSDIKIKKQDYDDLSSKKRKEREKEDAIEYLTAVSYVFISNFPQGYFEKSIDDFQVEVMQNLSNFSQDLTNYGFFEDIAENSSASAEELLAIEVPEDFIDLHMEGLYLLRYASDLYKTKSYTKSEYDIVPLISDLAQMQGLIELSMQFQEKFEEKITEYEIEDTFLSL